MSSEKAQKANKGHLKKMSEVRIGFIDLKACLQHQQAFKLFLQMLLKACVSVARLSKHHETLHQRLEGACGSQHFASTCRAESLMRLQVS